MKAQGIKVQEVVNHWIKTSDEDFDTIMIDLFGVKRYHWALFLGHISTEKLLKAYFVKIKHRHSPPIYNLLRIAEKSNLELTEEYADWLDVISLFNINARYDDFKREFYKQCTEDFTREWMDRIKEIREWIKKKL